MRRYTFLRQGFTLIELLVVVAVIGILSGLTIPAVQAVRSSAHRISCANQARQIGLACHQFEATFGYLPPGINGPDHAKHPSMSWLTYLLPYLEQENLWQQAASEYAASPTPFIHATIQSPVRAFQCPSDPRSGAPQLTHGNYLVGLTSYVGVNGTDYLSRDGVFYKDSQIRFAEIKDGLSHCLMIAERPPSADNWYGWWHAGRGQGGSSGSPDMVLGAQERNDGALYCESCDTGPYAFGPGKMERQCDLFHYWSLHPGGGNFVLCDGSTKFISYSASDIVAALATRSGREVASLD